VQHQYELGIGRIYYYYCNVALAGLPSCDLDRLQSVINAAARLTVGALHHHHITPLLADLHWLRIPQRIQYKLCVLVYQCVQRSAPSYLQNAICPVASAPVLRVIARSPNFVRSRGRE